MGGLLVIVNDRLSNLIRKGEITPRYYNPGEVFPVVHLAMTNDDHPDRAALQPTVGQAKLVLHNLPAGKALFVRTLGWRPWLLQRWAQQAVRLAREVRPTLVRCYGNHLNAFAAGRIKRELGIPYIVSVHTAGDGGGSLLGAFSQRLFARASLGLERQGLAAADLVIPVYQSIIPYLHRMGVYRLQVIYNALHGKLRQKTDYRLHSPVRIVSVSRQLRAKDPTHLLEAIRCLPNVRLTLIGDGPRHERLRQRAAQLGIGERVEFRPAVPNDELSRTLADYDIFAAHSEYAEISKAVLEALLVGLPVVINRRQGAPVPELQGGFVHLVENTEAGYLSALQQLIENDAVRECLGRKAYAEAWRCYAPTLAEKQYAEVHRSLAAWPRASARNPDGRLARA